MAPVLTPGSTPVRYAVRKITSDDLRWALAEGWRDFQDKRGDLIFVALLYPAIGLIAAVLLFNDAALPLFFPVAAGLSILGPAVAAGFYELARRREEGLESTWRHFFDPLFGPARDTLLLLTVGLLVIFGFWVAFAYGIYATTMGPEFPVGIADFARRLVSTPSGWALIVLGNLAGALFALTVLVCSLVSFPMAVDKPVNPAIALDTSIRAFRANPATIVAWGARVGLLLVLGALPAFIGLAVVLPVLGYATWHLYTRLVERG